MIRTSGASVSIFYLVIFAQMIAADPAVGGQFADVPNAEWAQIISFARGGWKSLRQPKSSWRADVGTAITYVEDGQQRHEPYQYSVNQGDHCGLLQTHSRTHSEITAWNGDYAFRLFKKANPPDSPYKIDYVGKDEALRLRVVGHNANAMHVGFADADHLVQSDKFSIRKMTRSDDRRFVAIVFSSDYELPNGSGEIVKDGTFTLDMNLFAAVTEYSIHTKAKNGRDWCYEGKMNYVNYNGIPHPKSSSTKSGFSGIDPHIIASSEFTNVRSADLNEADCRLSAFGFPEPGFFNQSSKGRWRMLLVVGNIAAGLVGFAIWRRSRRRAN